MAIVLLAIVVPVSVFVAAVASSRVMFRSGNEVTGCGVGSERRREGVERGRVEAPVTSVAPFISIRLTANLSSVYQY